MDRMEREKTPDKSSPMEVDQSNENKPPKGNKGKGKQRSSTPKPTAASVRRPALKPVAQVAAASGNAKPQDSAPSTPLPDDHEDMDQSDGGQEKDEETPYYTNVAVQIGPKGNIYSSVTESTGLLPFAKEILKDKSSSDGCTVDSLYYQGELTRGVVLIWPRCKVTDKVIYVGRSPAMTNPEMGMKMNDDGTCTLTVKGKLLRTEKEESDSADKKA